MKKRLALVILVVATMVFGLSVAGCSTQRKDPDTIVIWWGAGEKYKAPLLDAISRYQTDHPDFKYDIQFQSSNDYFSKYQAQLLAGNAAVPDVIVMGHTNIQNLAANKRVADLTALGAGDIEDKFLESTWNANSYSGKTYGLPLDANTTALMYNKDLFDKAETQLRAELGLQPSESVYPNENWDYDDFLKACKALKSAGVTPFEFPSLADSSGFTAMFFTSWLARAGETILSEDLKASNMNSDKAKATLQKIADMEKNGYFNAGPWEEGSFYAGKIAMLEMGSWNLGEIHKEGQNFGVTQVVKFSDEVGSISPLGLYSLAISETCLDKSTAYDLIKFLTTDVTFTTKYTQNQKVFSSLKETLENPYYSDGDMAVFKKALETAVSRQGSPVWNKVETYVQQCVESVLVSGSKRKTVEKALSDCNALIQRELDKK